MDAELLDKSLAYHGSLLMQHLVEEHGESLHVPTALQRRYSNPDSPIKDRWSIEDKKDAAFVTAVQKFIARKADMLFQPVRKKKKDVETQDQPEDIFGIMPPLESFMGLPPEICQQHFYESLSEGDFVIGVVESVSDSGVIASLLCTDTPGLHRDIDELDISVFCPAKELPRMFAHQSLTEAYHPHDIFRGIVLAVNQDKKKIFVSLKDHNSSDQKDILKIGLISKDDFPVYYRRKTQRCGLTFSELLHSILGFTNKGSVEALQASLELSDSESMMRGLHRAKIPAEEFAERLRKWQVSRQAHNNVVKGVEMVKKGNHLEAIQHLNMALKIDPTHTEALVARGALYANNASYHKAIEDFELALEADPKHVNAKKYLIETRLVNARRYEESGDVKEALENYREILKTDPHSGEAKQGVERCRRYQGDDVQGKGQIPAEGESLSSSDEGEDRLQRSADKLKRLMYAEKKDSKKRRRSGSLHTDKKSEGKKEKQKFPKQTDSSDSSTSQTPPSPHAELNQLWEEWQSLQKSSSKAKPGGKGKPSATPPSTSKHYSPPARNRSRKSSRGAKGRYERSVSPVTPVKYRRSPDRPFHLQSRQHSRSSSSGSYSWKSSHSRRDSRSRSSSSSSTSQSHSKSGSFGPRPTAVRSAQKQEPLSNVTNKWDDLSTYIGASSKLLEQVIIGLKEQNKAGLGNQKVRERSHSGSSSDREQFRKRKQSSSSRDRSRSGSRSGSVKFRESGKRMRGKNLSRSRSGSRNSRERRDHMRGKNLNKSHSDSIKYRVSRERLRGKSRSRSRSGSRKYRDNMERMRGKSRSRSHSGSKKYRVMRDKIRSRSRSGSRKYRDNMERMRGKNRNKSRSGSRKCRDRRDKNRSSSRSGSRNHRDSREHLKGKNRSRSHSVSKKRRESKEQMRDVRDWRNPRNSIGERDNPRNSIGERDNPRNSIGERDSARNSRGERDNARNSRGERDNARNSRGERDNARNSREERDNARNSIGERDNPRNSIGERDNARNSREERDNARNSREERDNARNSIGERDNARNSREERDNARNSREERDNARNSREERDNARNSIGERDNARNSREERDNARNSREERDNARNSREERDKVKHDLVADYKHHESRQETISKLDHKVSRDSLDHKVSRDSLDHKVSRDSLDHTVSRDSLDHKVSRDSLDHTVSRDSLDHRVSRDSMDLRVSNIDRDNREFPVRMEDRNSKEFEKLKNYSKSQNFADLQSKQALKPTLSQAKPWEEDRQKESRDEISKKLTDSKLAGQRETANAGKVEPGVTETKDVKAKEALGRERSEKEGQERENKENNTIYSMSEKQNVKPKETLGREGSVRNEKEVQERENKESTTTYGNADDSSKKVISSQESTDDNYGEKYWKVKEEKGLRNKENSTPEFIRIDDKSMNSIRYEGKNQTTDAEMADTLMINQMGTVTVISKWDSPVRHSRWDSTQSKYASSADSLDDQQENWAESLKKEWKSQDQKEGQNLQNVEIASKWFSSELARKGSKGEVHTKCAIPDKQLSRDEAPSSHTPGDLPSKSPQFTVTSKLFEDFMTSLQSQSETIRKRDDAANLEKLTDHEKYLQKAPQIRTENVHQVQKLKEEHRTKDLIEEDPRAGLLEHLSIQDLEQRLYREIAAHFSVASSATSDKTGLARYMLEPRRRFEETKSPTSSKRSVEENVLRIIAGSENDEDKSTVMQRSPSASPHLLELTEACGSRLTKIESGESTKGARLMQGEISKDSVPYQQLNVKSMREDGKDRIRAGGRHYIGDKSPSREMHSTHTSEKKDLFERLKDQNSKQRSSEMQKASSWMEKIISNIKPSSKPVTRDVDIKLHVRTSAPQRLVAETVVSSASRKRRKSRSSSESSAGSYKKSGHSRKGRPSSQGPSSKDQAGRKKRRSSSSSSSSSTESKDQRSVSPSSSCSLGEQRKRRSSSRSVSKKEKIQKSSKRFKRRSSSSSSSASQRQMSGQSEKNPQTRPEVPGQSTAAPAARIAVAVSTQSQKFLASPETSKLNELENFLKQLKTKKKEQLIAEGKVKKE